MRNKSCVNFEMVLAKGKDKVVDLQGGKGKRKSNFSGPLEKTGSQLKRRNHGVIQFFDDIAYEANDEADYSSDNSQFNTDDFIEDDKRSELILSIEPEEVPPIPLLCIEEELMNEEELDRIMEERYKPGAGFVTYEEDGSYEHETSTETDVDYVPLAIDPKIWKVKCTIGRERYSALCLMHKYVDMKKLGMELQIVSAFAPDHAKGFIVIEAEKQNDIYQACKGLSTINLSRITLVPDNEISRLISVRTKSTAISRGMWARVKNGKYKGDLSMVLAVNDLQKKVTVKLVPRIDLKAMAEKFGGGVAVNRTSIPPQRRITSKELDEFRPLIHSRRDRDTKEMVEVLDGMMLKDGFLYKKIPLDSLSFWGIIPTEDELSKFESSSTMVESSIDGEWLSELYGEKPEMQIAIFDPDKGSGNVFEMHDLVFFGKHFGVVICSENDETVKVMKETSEGPFVVTVNKKELKIASFDARLFSVLDHNSSTISTNDRVRVLDGPLKDKQGLVKKIYKGILFLFDESEEENNGYICTRAQLCEKVNISDDTSNEKVEDNESEHLKLANLASPPNTPLFDKSNFRRDDNEIFSVGQSLRIRVGPLKGYLCRVMAIRRSNVIVKLDSQQKILTVKIEDLSEVRGMDSAVTHREEYGSMKPFEEENGMEDLSWKINTASDQNSSCTLWNKASAGFSFWDEEPVVNAEIRPKESWGRSKPLGRGHNSGADGRRGRGRGRGRGGRDESKGKWSSHKAGFESKGGFGLNHNGKDYKHSGAWNVKKNVGGASNGWGQETTWSSKTNIVNGDEDNSFSQRGRGRGGSNRGGIRGGRGGYGGRGGSEKVGVSRGKGGFRGRGRGKRGW